jgi:hypothetical protein
MQTLYFIYKIICLDPNVSDEYIGLTSSLKKTISDYKYKIENENDRSYNTKLFQTIRENNGWQNWLLFSIEMVVTDDVKIARKRQTELMKLNNNSLNMKNSFTSKEETRLQAKKYLEKNKDKLHEKIQCHCGGNYTRQGQSRHFKTATHILNDPVYTKHRRENLLAYQSLDEAALKNPSLATPYILLCWKLREERLKAKNNI